MEAPPATSVSRVLFVCGHNAGRSIAAEAIATKLRPDLVVRSCGTVPSGTINPKMKEALEEHGYSTSGLFSKAHDDATVGGYENGYDLIITMGCMDGQCPWTKSIPRVDWGLPDPAADASVIPAVIRRIEECVRAL